MKRRKNAYILELRGGYAAALTEDGQFVRVPDRGYAIGQAVVLRPAENRPNRARFAALASVAAGFVLLLAGGFAGYAMPAGVVSLDVNPSVEYSINCFDRVLSIDAVNEDAQAIVDLLDEEALRYESVDTAVEQTILALRESGYLLEESENDVVLSASSYSAAHAEQLASRLEEQTAEQEDLTVVSVSVTSSEVKAAHALGTSAGKLYIVERLQESSGETESFDTGEWLQKPVREIMQETAEQAQTQQDGGAQAPAAGSAQEAPLATPDGGEDALNAPAERPSASPAGEGLPEDGEKQDEQMPDAGQQGPSGGGRQGAGNPPG